MTEYIECSERDIPKSIRFDVPQRNAGQIVEVAYGTFSRGEAGHGDPYQRVTDQSIAPGKPGHVTYYHLAEAR